MKLLRAAAALALLVSAAACDLTGSDADEGMLAFTYSGAESGAYEARGEHRGGIGWHGYAAGGVYTGAYLRVEAWDGGAVADVFYLVGGPTQPGTYAFGTPGSGSAFLGALILDADRRNGDSSRSFDLASGTLVLEEVTEERIRGRFSGTAVDPADPTSSIVITDGHFDVPNTLEPPIID